MRKFIKSIAAMSLAMMMIVSGISTAGAATTNVHRDDWYLNKITPTTGTFTDTVSLKVNDKTRSYTGVCSNSTSSYDSVAMGGTSVTTITSSVSVYRQAGDVQTVTANTSSGSNAKFKMTLTCNNGSAVNEGYVYWIQN